ncbi:MAG: ATP-binding protein [Vicinamibacterales bacterium]
MSVQAHAFGAAVPIVAPQTFILATRETGYRNLSAALSELIDNSLQAAARDIRIFTRDIEEGGERSILVGVLDDGNGMSLTTLSSALQFGGTDRFGDRSGLGRFGMGLPNSSVSQTRRLEVYSWQRPDHVLYTYLDVDDVASGLLQGIPAPVRRPLPLWLNLKARRSGTLVLWTRCDRLRRYRPETLARRLQRTLGRLYRFSLWEGAKISINDTAIQPFDPLFLDPRAKTFGARLYGVPLRYEVRTPGGVSILEARFAELPVEKWHGWSVEEKRAKGIVGGGGVSIVRAGREIDYGWHLFGGKRRENYDDWWRCEIRFTPDLDELFGVTHSKQGISPRAELKVLLSSDFEAVARSLNRRVRNAFERARGGGNKIAAIVASRNDALLPPPTSLRSRTITAGGLRYRLDYRPIAVPDFYAVRLLRDSIIVSVNTDHPFFTEIYRRASGPTGCGLEHIEGLVLAAARADLEARNVREREHVSRLRRAWSDALAAFLRP